VRAGLPTPLPTIVAVAPAAATCAANAGSTTKAAAIMPVHIQRRHCIPRHSATRGSQRRPTYFGTV